MNAFLYSFGCKITNNFQNYIVSDIKTANLNILYLFGYKAGMSFHKSPKVLSLFHGDCRLYLDSYIDHVCAMCRHGVFPPWGGLKELLLCRRYASLVDVRPISFHGLFLGRHFCGLGLHRLHLRMGGCRDTVDYVSCWCHYGHIYCSKMA